ncbi:MAG TPA: phosphopantetheine-binding protein [Steroidobacteraceae bacterium]
MPAIQTTAETELAELIIAAVNLEGVRPADIDPETPLFGAGLGLDSIDALEIALEVSRQYGLQLRSDDTDNRRIFASLRSLATYIQQHSQQPSQTRGDQSPVTD